MLKIKLIFENRTLEHFYVKKISTYSGGTFTKFDVMLNYVFYRRKLTFFNVILRKITEFY